MRRWQPMLGQPVGQLAPSHFSPASTTPLPHLGAQSLSLVASQVPGQQPSPAAHAVCVPSSTQRAVQEAAEPASFCLVQPSAGQLVGHELGGSQTSPVSTTPLPQAGWQSLSLVALQLGGQQPSPPTHAVCVPA